MDARDAVKDQAELIKSSNRPHRGSCRYTSPLRQTCRFRNKAPSAGTERALVIHSGRDFKAPTNFPPIQGMARKKMRRHARG